MLPVPVKTVGTGGSGHFPIPSQLQYNIVIETVSDFGIISAILRK
jgi:hypothetical protein